MITDDVEVKPFNKDKAIFLKEIKENEMRNGKDKEISKIVNHVRKVYEKKIVDAIDKDYKTRSVKIRLPYLTKKVFKKHKDMIRNIFREEYEGLGFHVYVYDNASACVCPLDYVCNRDFGVELIFG